MIKNCCLLLGAIFLMSLQTDKWTVYHSQKGHFAISFPTAKPTENAQKISLHNQAYTQNLVYCSQNDGYTYVLAWTDMDKVALYQSTENFLKDSRDAAVNNVKGTNLVTQKLVATGEQPYIEFTYDADKLKTKTRIYYINKIEYSIIVLSEKEKNITAKADKFIHGFSYRK